MYYVLIRKNVRRLCSVLFLKKIFNFRYFMKILIDNIVNITNIHIMCILSIEILKVNKT